MERGVSGSRACLFKASATLVGAALFAAGSPALEGRAAPQAAGMVFQQASADGLVVMEAENFGVNTSQGGHSWTLVTTPTGFTGSGAMEATPNATAVNNNTGYTTASPRLDFRVAFVATGTHYVWVRGRAQPLPGPGENDSCHAGIDGDQPGYVENPNSTSDRISTFVDTAYRWSNATMDNVAATFNVPSIGVHSVNIWMRENGFIVDRILLTTNAAYSGVTQNGTMAGPAESAQIPDPTMTAPTLSGTPGVGSANLSWTSVSNATSYNVLRSTTSGGPYTLVANVTGTTYVDSGLSFTQTYYYVVQGVNAFGVGPNSNQVAITPLQPPPRTNDHEEGLFGTNCGCGAAIPPGLPAALAGGALLAAAFLRRRR